MYVHYPNEKSNENEKGERERGCYTMKYHLSKTMCAWGHKLEAISDGGEINQN